MPCQFCGKVGLCEMCEEAKADMERDPNGVGRPASELRERMAQKLGRSPDPQRVAEIAAAHRAARAKSSGGGRDMSDCNAALLESSDPDRSRWWCPKCGPNISGPCPPYPNEPQGKTHFPGCYRQPMHHNCAVWEVDRLRAQLDTAREALHRLSHYHSSPALMDVPQTTKQVRQIAKGTLAALDATDTGGEDE